jgi:hypothetical protein
MSLRVFAPLLLLGACGGAPPVPEADLLLQVAFGVEEVELGRGFPLEVVRVWRKDLVPEAWSDRALAPLVVRLEEAAHREDGARVEERLRYRAHAFTPGPLTLAGVKLAAHSASGEERAVFAEPARLRVLTTVDPAAPGPPELPDGPLAEPRPWWVRIAAGLALLAAAAFAVARARRRPPPPSPESPARATPRDRALLALARIRARPAPDLHARQEDFAEAAAVLREFVAERFGLPAAQRTTEEILAGAPSEALAALLRAADRVKFAAAKPGEAERRALLDGADAYVSRT